MSKSLYSVDDGELKMNLDESYLFSHISLVILLSYDIINLFSFHILHCFSPFVEIRDLEFVYFYFFCISF